MKKQRLKAFKIRLVLCEPAGSGTQSGDRVQGPGSSGLDLGAVS